MRRLNHTIQIAKMCFAAGLSWYLATLVSPHRNPYFAPLAVVITFQASLAGTVAKAWYRIAGIVGGVIVALLVSQWLHVGAVTIGLAVLIGVGLGRLLRLDPQIVSQVAVTVVMVLASSGTPHYAAYRIFESLLGAVVGVAVNALILPAGSLAQAEAAVLDAADMLATSLLNLSRGAQAAPGEIEQKIRSSFSHVADAQATVRLTPFAQTRRARLKLLTAAMGRLEQVGRQVRSIAHELTERPGAPSHGLAEALQDAAACLSTFRAEIATPSDELYAQMRTAIARSHASQMRCLASLKEAASLTEMRDLGVILANLDHILKELRVDLREYGDRPAADQPAA